MPTPKKSTKKAPAVKLLPLVKNDPYLIPFAAAIAGRHEDAVRKEKELTAECGSLKELANGHEYFGMHRNAKGGWTFREWAPNATRVVLIGDFSDWKAVARYELARKDNGVWELDLPNEAIHHGDLYKLLVSWQGGEGERIPAYATRVVQDKDTHLFSAQVWEPERPYVWTVNDFKPEIKPLMIYECHIGMAQEREGVGTYVEFRDLV